MEDLTLYNGGVEAVCSKTMQHVPRLFQLFAMIVVFNFDSHYFNIIVTILYCCALYIKISPHLVN